MSKDWTYNDFVKSHDILVKEEGRFRFYDAYMSSRTPGAWLSSSNVPLKEAMDAPPRN